MTIPQNISTTAVALNLTSAAGALREAGAPQSFGILPTNLTAFIPNDEAFQAIASVVGNLSTEDLTRVLGYHLVPNMTLYTSDLSNMSLPTFSDANVTITTVGSDVFINQARVAIVNVLIEEGVLHVIDAVLNPDNATATPVPGETDGVPAFPGATSGTQVPFTSGISAPTSVPGGDEASATGGAESSSSSDLAVPMITGAVGMGALFGVGAAVLNL